MFSVWTTVAAYATVATNYRIDIVTAASNLVLLAATIMWFACIVSNNVSLVFQFYSKILGTHNKSIIMLVEILTHFMPALLLGMPKNKLSYVYALSILTVWYIVYRKQMREIYMGIINPDKWSDAVLLLIWIVLMIWMM